MSSSQADVGIILRQNDDAILHDAQDDAPEAKYDGPVKGTRIDATMRLRRQILLAFPHLQVLLGGGHCKHFRQRPDFLFRVSLPVTPSQEKSIKANSWKTNDDVFTNIYQVESHSVDMQNPVWDS